MNRPLIMGILNVTPDSFSGDGVMQSDDYVAAATAQAIQMRADGAAIIDIGGESTRPGSEPISPEEEQRRVIPVIKAISTTLKNHWRTESKGSDGLRFSAAPLAGEVGKGGRPLAVATGHPSESLSQSSPLRLSIDTTSAATAAAALDAGAHIINDISGGTRDPAMLPLAATHNVPIILMHNRSAAHAVAMREILGGEYLAPAYKDVIEDVRTELAALAEAALAAGVKPENIILDPGIGFGKTVEQNLRLINELDSFASLGYPILAGPSRKSFIGRILDLPPEDRLEGTAACIAICVLRGAAILRVHDVKEMKRIVAMTAAITGNEQ